jgi:hypothetical protein
MCDKPTWVSGLAQNGPGERLDTASRDPGGIPKSPGGQGDPTCNDKPPPGTEELPTSSLPPGAVNVQGEEVSTACGWERDCLRSKRPGESQGRG